MATGGFKAFEVTWTGSSSRSVQTSIKQIIHDVCAGIIAQGFGWDYDTDYTEDADTYTQIGTTNNDSYYSFCQFLKNTNTGSRLCVIYSSRAAYVQLNSACFIADTSKQKCGGLCFSMIPGGSSQTWDTSSACTTADFIPNEGTCVLGMSVSGDSCVFYNTYGRLFRWVLVLKDDLLFCFCRTSAGSSTINGIAVGKVFEKLCNEEDSGACSKYGAIAFTNSIHPEYTSQNSYIDSTTTASAFSDCYETYFRTDTSQRAATGLMYNSGYYSMRGNYTNGASLENTVTSPNKTNKVIFGAYLRYIATQDASNYGVVSGNGMKGYWDTDAFRSVYVGLPYGTLLDGGNFVYVGGGLAIGWDPSNTISIR